MINTIKRPNNNIFFFFALKHPNGFFEFNKYLESNHRTMGEYAVAQNESWIQTCVLGSEPAHARLHHMQFQRIQVLTI